MIRIALILMMLSMSDSHAMVVAKGYWGTLATIRQFRIFADNLWTMEVGFKSPGCKDQITIMGQATDGTWDSAFNAIVGPPNGGTWSGSHTLTADSPGADPAPQYTLATNAFIGKIASFQFILDGAPLNAPIPVTTVPWSVSTTWNTVISADGAHYICGSMIHDDGSSELTAAGIVILKNH